MLFHFILLYFIVFYLYWVTYDCFQRKAPGESLLGDKDILWFDLISVEIIYLRFLPGEGPRWPPPWQGHAFIFLLRSILFVCFLFYSNVSAPKGKPRRPPGRQRYALILFDLILVWFSLVWFNLICFSLVWFNSIYDFIFL